MLQDASGVVADAMLESYNDGYKRGLSVGRARNAAEKSDSEVWRDGYERGRAAARARLTGWPSAVQLELVKAALASGNPVAAGDVLARLQQEDGLRGQQQHDPDQEQDRGF